jgi:Putative bacterial sensory transduction regulator
MSADATTEQRETVERFLAELEGETRRVAADEWGLTVDAGGWPLHVGIALREGLLRAQAEVVGPGRINPHVLLRWNRELPLVRFSHTGAGAVYVQGELPPAAVTPAQLDRFLGLLVRVAIQAREAAGSPP